MYLRELPMSLFTCIQILAAAFLFAWSLPRREPTRPRAIAACLFVLAWSALLALLMSQIASNPVLIVVVFSLTICATSAITYFVFESSVWSALFCSTAGYTMQNLASGISSGAFALLGKSLSVNIVWQVLPFVVVYALCYVALISRIKQSGLELVQPQVALGAIVLVICAVIAFDVVVKELYNYSLPLELILGCRVAHTLLCITILYLEYELLYNRRLSREVTTITRLMEDEREQYQLSKRTIETINLKCHDIRHQIRQIGQEHPTIDQHFIDEAAKEVSIYDSAIKTGNEPLDVILTEKSLTCSKDKIALSTIVDGTCLSFMSPSDIYSLIGNALDNAIEAVQALDDPSMRTISVVIEQRGDMVIIHVENYFKGQLTFEDNLPQTTKDDKDAHGWGMKSMRLVVSRYGGAMHTNVRGNIFHLNAVIPHRKDAQDAEEIAPPDDALGAAS